MATAQAARLFDQETLRARIEAGALPEWVGDKYAFFRESMLADEFAEITTTAALLGE